MRLVGTFDDERSVRLLSSLLKEEGIATTFESKIDPSTNEKLFHLWVYDEGKADQAKALVQFYLRNPDDPRFEQKLPLIESAEPSASKEKPKRPPLHLGLPPMTKWIIILCALLFFWNSIEQMRARKKIEIAEEVAMTSLEQKLLFDYPELFIELNQLLKKYNVTTKEDYQKLSPGQKTEVKKIEQIPYWKGFYELVLNWPKSKILLKTPLFHDILQGEVWRIITPVFLHGNLLHILFNMLWLWMLGKQVEERIGAWRYLSISLIVGVISNVSQYLMSGPFFLGYSGIIAGLAGFIWMRQKIAPWEGYPLQKMTIIFLVIFILAMLGLQIISFFLQTFNILNLPLPIANTAHIVGALVGIILARFTLFSRGIR